jgi:cytochrome c oxidase subunit IV
MSEPTPDATVPHAKGYDSYVVEPPEDPTHWRMYVGVFIALCVCTALSFVFNQVLGQNSTSAALITLVAIVKAGLVAMVFMHLTFDWRRVYGIMIPVVIMAVMTVIILSIDIGLVWHHGHAESDAAPAAHGH